MSVHEDNIADEKQREMSEKMWGQALDKLKEVAEAS